MDTYAFFDTESGTYIFQSTNRDKYPPGEYIFNIYGTSGGMTAVTKIVMTLADHPCSRVKIELRDNPFEDVNYVLGDKNVIIPWFTEQLIASRTTH